MTRGVNDNFQDQDSFDEMKFIALFTSIIDDDDTNKKLMTIRVLMMMMMITTCVPENYR